jgi:hypothetical protein
MVPAVRALLTEGDWLSEPYVDRREAVTILHRSTVDTTESGGADLIMLSEFATLEAWLRRIRQAVNCDIN